MNYTNGFDFDAVLPALQQRLGWMQPTVSGSPVINSGNLTSKSGRFFNDNSFHSLCTVDNIRSVQEDNAISDGNFNTFLQTLQNSAISRALNNVFREPELIEQVLMYTRYGYNDLPIANTNLWVGWAINVANDQAYSTQITMGTFYFDHDVTFNMYLFQDGVRAPIKTISIAVVAYQHTEVDFDSLVLPFKTGAKYYFMYNQAELGGAKAIREQVETIATTRLFEAFNVQFYPATDGSYFNHNNRQYTALPQGVNLEIVSFRDHTQKIIRGAKYFDEVQGLQMAATVVEMINTTTRTNATQRQGEQQSQQLFIELNQAFPTKDVPVSAGLKARVEKEFKRLRDTFFAPEQPISISQNTCNSGLDAYEQTWAKQNAMVIQNPGVIVT